MRLGFVQTERLPLGLVLEVDMLQFLIDHLGERVCLLLVDLLIGKLVVEMVLRLPHIGKSDEELGLDTRLFLRLVYRVHELRFVEFLARHGDDAVDLRYHVYRRGIEVLAADLHEVVHVVPEEPRIGRHIGAIAFAELQLVNLFEMLVGLIQFALLHELVVVELREKHRLVRIVQRETEPALRGDIPEFLIEGLVPIELVHVLVHVYLGVAAFPGTEVLEPRPEVARVQMSLLGEYLPQFRCALGSRGYVCVQLGPYLERDIHILADGAVLDIGDHLLGVLVERAQQLQNGRWVSRCPEGHVAVLERQTHQHIVPRAVVRDGHHGGGSRVVLLDDGRYVAYQHAAHGAEERAVRRVTLYFLAHRREDMSAEDTAAVLHEVPGPYMAHAPVHVFEVLMGHRDPFGLRGRARSGGVHIRLAGEEHVLLAVLMALHVRAERLERVVHRHVEPVQPEEILRARSRENPVEMVLPAIDGIAGYIEDVAERLLRRMTGFPAPHPEPDGLHPADNRQHKIDDPRIG